MMTDTVPTSVPYRTMLWLFLTIIVLQLPVQAQDSDSSRGVSFGVNYQQMVPRGEFRGNTRGAPLSWQSALGVDLMYQPFRNFGFGIGFRSLLFELKVEEASRELEVRQTFQGPILFVTGSF